MADVKDCPRCGLVNPPSAERCDCGYDFVSHTVERISHKEAQTYGSLVFWVVIGNGVCG